MELLVLHGASILSGSSLLVLLPGSLLFKVLLHFLCLGLHDLAYVLVMELGLL